jgi:hypothetical protein
MARRKTYYLADGQTIQGVVTPAVIAADGNYPATPGYVDWEGGDGAFMVAGTVGGGTYTLQMQCPDGSTWVALGAATTLTAAGAAGFTAPAGRLRVAVTGSAGASAKAWVVGIPTNNGG